MPHKACASRTHIQRHLYAPRRELHFLPARYPARLQVGLEEPIRDRNILGEKVKTIGFPREHPTVASLIKKAGYDTALIGKWHVGYLSEFGPLKSGLMNSSD